MKAPINLLPRMTGPHSRLFPSSLLKSLEKYQHNFLITFPSPQPLSHNSKTSSSQSQSWQTHQDVREGLIPSKCGMKQTVAHLYLYPPANETSHAETAATAGTTREGTEVAHRVAITEVAEEKTETAEEGEMIEITGIAQETEVCTRQRC